MKNQMSKQGLATLLLALTALTLIGCSKGSTSSSSDQASRTVDTTDSTKAYVSCNVTASDSASFKIHIAAYMENGSPRPDLMYARFSQIPSDFDGNQIYLQMYRWQASSATGTNVDQTPLSFRIIHPTTHEELISSRTSIRYSDISSYLSSWGISSTEFFKRTLTIIDVRDTAAAYDVLMTVVYNSSNVARDRANTLLPIFDANPANYAYELDGVTARPASLQNLHPFKAQLNSGWSTATFQANANTLCSIF